MSTIQLALLTAWVVVGIIVTVRWKMSEPEVSLLDLICAIIGGAVFGVLGGVLVWANGVKLKGLK